MSDLDGVRNSTKQLIEQYLTRSGLSTMTGQTGHEVRNQKKRVYQVVCQLCGTKNRSTRIRCRGCDAFIVVRKPTGTDQEQKDYLKEYADNFSDINRQKGHRPKAIRKKVPTDR